MNLKIKTQHLNLSDRQKELIHDKVGKLSHLAERLSDESSEFRVELRHEKAKKPMHQYVCQLTIFAPRAVIRAETRQESVENSVDECVSKIRHQIERYKSRIEHLDKKGGNSVRTMESESPKDEFEMPKILRRKRFSNSQPMSEDAAIERMELVGHDFFLFSNADTGRFSIVYKRHDGYYGIVEPKTEKD